MYNAININSSIYEYETSEQTLTYIFFRLNALRATRIAILIQIMCNKRRRNAKDQKRLFTCSTWT